MKVHEITAKIKNLETKAKLNFDVIFLVSTEEEALDCFNRYYYGNSEKYEVKNLKIKSFDLVSVEKCNISLFTNKIGVAQ